ncbi:phosphoribosyltransferase [Mycobacterium sp. CBMA 234]|uniref:ComF family protein n=1 Tax=Mycolicibacterium sp. CBMA 234 TaxID=1918495 RepID=UPI0012DEB1DF|nr:ComF family protein [Mycolicibacterium sp. CBMA 234]MUL67618.1 phosphoribosyltransferase [Mycolicibacterium sp. CBMA 234]
MLDLVLPIECGGCGAPSTRWCAACAAELVVRPDEPHVITPRQDPGVPVLALGRYAGARRQAIVGLKEHGRTDLVPPLAGAVAAALGTLIAWGVVVPPVTVVPAPTRSLAARRRGGDPVTKIARMATAGVEGVAVEPVLTMRAFTRDSVGLSSAQRQRNVVGRVRQRAPVRGEAVVFDDVVTTGATAAEAVRVLQTSGTYVSAVLAIAHA